MEKELEELITSNLGLVYDVVNKHSTKILPFIEYDDAIQIGTLGLIRAANTFDKTRQVAFSTYAYTCIKNYLSTQLYKERQRGNSQDVLSLDAIVLEGQDDTTLLNILEGTTNVAEEVADNSMILLLYKYIDELKDDTQKQIMRLRLKDKTFEQIAYILDKPKSVVYLNYQRALNILRYKFKNYGGD